jgi:hypothetical protein
MYRLAEYDESILYYNYLNELFEVCDNEVLRPIYNLIEQLDENIHKYSWVGDFDPFLYTQIIPHMKKSLQNIDGESLDVLLQLIDLYLNEYKKMVAYECGVKTKKELNEFFKNCDKLMQECAVEFLVKNEYVDFVLVGMRKAKYVNELVG